MNHSRWQTARMRAAAEGATETPEVEAERVAIRLSMDFAKVVYDRRIELGLSQAELADRAGLTQAKISRIEGSDTVPTVALLWRLAGALDGTLSIELDGQANVVRFAAHHLAA